MTDNRKRLLLIIAVLIIAIGVLIVMSIAVVPKFEGMFADMGATLPGSTRALMAFSSFIMTKWYIAIIAIAGLIILISAIKKTP